MERAIYLTITYYTYNGLDWTMRQWITCDNEQDMRRHVKDALDDASHIEWEAEENGVLIWHGSTLD